MARNELDSREKSEVNKGVGEIKTEKYNNMITAFRRDFTEAKEDKNKLDKLNWLIKVGNKRIMRNIELLEELEYGLRHGTLQIMKVKE